jgi:hypothetical protein
MPAAQAFVEAFLRDERQQNDDGLSFPLSLSLLLFAFSINRKP